MKQCPKESWEQMQVVSYCDAKEIPIFHIPNGTHVKSVSTRVILKREGLKRGVPDLSIPVANKMFHGLYIEMKRKYGTKSDLKPYQREWIVKLNKNGYYAVVCFGHEEAIGVIDQFISNTLPEQQENKIHPNQKELF